MSTGNSLLDGLPEKEAELLRSSLKWTTLEKDSVLIESGQESDRLYFPASGLVSCAVSTSKGDHIEVHSAGAHDIIGLPWTQRQPWRATVQIAGFGTAVEWRHIARLLPRLPTLRDALHRYVSLLMADVGRRALCAYFHPVEARVCLWLIQTMAIADTAELECTHQSIADALGVRRATVSVVCGQLQRKKIIRSRRGRIFILDKPALEAKACECVAVLAHRPAS